MGQVLTFKLVLIEEDELGEIRVARKTRSQVLFELGQKLPMPSLMDMEEWFIEELNKQREAALQEEDQRLFDLLFNKLDHFEKSSK